VVIFKKIRQIIFLPFWQTFLWKFLRLSKSPKFKKKKIAKKAKIMI